MKNEVTLENVAATSVAGETAAAAGANPASAGRAGRFARFCFSQPRSITSIVRYSAFSRKIYKSLWDGTNFNTETSLRRSMQPTRWGSWSPAD